jgi:hypothetical protein
MPGEPSGAILDGAHVVGPGVIHSRAARSYAHSHTRG